MLNLLRAGLFALACLAMPLPAQAQNCRPFEAVLSEAQSLASAGLRLEIMTGDEAQRAFTALVAAIGEPPRPLAVESVFILFGPDVAVLVLGEGVQACFQVPLRLETAARIMAAVRGEPA